MRIIFDIEGKNPQVIASTRAYSTGRVDQPPQWSGSRAEVTIVDCIDWESDEKRREGDAIHIEGDTEAICRALRQVLELLDIHDGFERKRVGDEIARTVVCPRCGRYADPKNEWHGDGRGRACYGLASQRLDIIRSEVDDAGSRQAASDARHEQWNQGDAADAVARGLGATTDSPRA